MSTNVSEEHAVSIFSDEEKAKYGVISQKIELFNQSGILFGSWLMAMHWLTQKTLCGIFKQPQYFSGSSPS
jgi:hypothetical protein